MSCCQFSSDDCAEIAEEKVRKAFPSHLKDDDKVVFLQCTKNGDLFPVDNSSLDGSKSVMSLAGASGLYVTVALQKIADDQSVQAIPSHVPEATEVKKNAPLTCLSDPPKLPEVPTPSSGQSQSLSACNKGGGDGLGDHMHELESSLFDNRLLYIVRSVSLWHQDTDQEQDAADPSEKLTLERGEFFLAVNTMVHFWIAYRKKASLPPLREVDNFCVTDEQLFREYDNFCDTVKLSHGDKLLLPASPLICKFLTKNSTPINLTSVCGIDAIDFPDDHVDELCEWMIKTQVDFTSEGFNVFS